MFLYVSSLRLGLMIVDVGFDDFVGVFQMVGRFVIMAFVPMIVHGGVGGQRDAQDTLAAEGQYAIAERSDADRAEVSNEDDLEHSGGFVVKPE